VGVIDEVESSYWARGQLIADQPAGTIFFTTKVTDKVVVPASGLLYGYYRDSANLTSITDIPLTKGIVAAFNRLRVLHLHTW
jgi:hypothetical protein